LISNELGEPLALDVNPQAFSAAHFATFPEKLVEPLIKAATSEKGCCPECGAPWVRQTETTGSRQDRWSPANALADEVGGTHRERTHTAIKSTTGWEPDCGCKGYWKCDRCGVVDNMEREVGCWKCPKGTMVYHDDPKPCTVLDPFCGSGTTLLVACRLGRDSIGIELSPDYARMAEDRIGKGLRPSTYTPGTGDPGPLFQEASDG